jgi:Transposase DDE domain
MRTGQTTQLWSLSSDSNEYERNLNLLSGRLKNSLSPEAINEQTLVAGLSNLSAKTLLEIIHDGSDIRKPHSKTLPHLTKVKSLEKQMVNGYNTFNSIVINDLDKQVHLLASTPYSTSDPHYNQAIGAGFTQNDIVLGQIKQTDEAVKNQFPTVKVRHLFDRGHDDQNLFEFVDDLASTFIVRAKSNRNSNEFTLDDKGKQVFIKLTDAALEQTQERVLEKFVWKNKVFQQAKMTITWGKLTLKNKTYSVAKVQVFDREKKAIFKDQMLLITNELVHNFDSAFDIYQAYLRRSKIENVFKFLKDQLGWEEFRVRDFMVIQNIITLCFFVAGYFYENQHEMVKDPKVLIICQLAKNKGKITKHFYLEGLKILANFILFQEFIKQQNLTQEQVNQLLSMV